MLIASPDHGRQNQVKAMSWSDYVQHGIFPMDLPRYAVQQSNGDWRPVVNTVVDYQNLEEGVDAFLSSCGLRGFRMVSKAKSGFRRDSRVPSVGQISEYERAKIMEAFRESNNLLRRYFSIDYS